LKLFFSGKIDREELRDILRATGALEHVATEDSYVDLILNLGDKNDDNELDIDGNYSSLVYFVCVLTLKNVSVIFRYR
jgi:hypothetical protein